MESQLVYLPMVYLSSTITTTITMSTMTHHDHRSTSTTSTQHSRLNTRECPTDYDGKDWT
ncbi:hypothetical protein ASPTUDRAFT_40279 [Aspergillus tubingensis CBS 134.48]|uniref:Uncharacterized protein n=1 Tax=Aspergillus tubingensis (strain CBS 134.48) TaxID=767770 RepID=A0A1L9ND06_ASPTC|nr:hypothetical protein ASPTUDRAFT_40279 [Aspergillus tubingensis CBS 134.48]